MELSARKTPGSLVGYLARRVNISWVLELQMCLPVVAQVPLLRAAIHVIN